MSYRVSPTAKTARARPRSAAVGPYKVETGSRQFRIRPLVFWTSASLMTAMALWSAGTATYFCTPRRHDCGLMTRQGEMQRGYEDRIATLRGADRPHVAAASFSTRSRSRQRVEQLANARRPWRPAPPRSAACPKSIPARSREPTPDRSSAAMGRPHRSRSPAPPLCSIASRRLARKRPTPARPTAPSASRHVHASLEELLDRIESASRTPAPRARRPLRRQGAASSRRARRDRHRPEEDRARDRQTARRRGPFVPVSEQAAANAFERQLRARATPRCTVSTRLSKTLVQHSGAQADRRRAGNVVGLRRSRRSVLRAPALHSGLDFRAQTGEPVRATAGGTIVNASWSGGYGRMVEIDHGNGLTTRYGHLSAILVQRRIRS